MVILSQGCATLWITHPSKPWWDFSLQKLPTFQKEKSCWTKSRIFSLHLFFWWTVTQMTLAEIRFKVYLFTCWQIHQWAKMSFLWEKSRHSAATPYQQANYSTGWENHEACHSEEALRSCLYHLYHTCTKKPSLFTLLLLSLLGWSLSSPRCYCSHCGSFSSQNQSAILISIV